MCCTRDDAAGRDMVTPLNQPGPAVRLDPAVLDKIWTPSSEEMIPGFSIRKQF